MEWSICHALLEIVSQTNFHLSISAIELQLSHDRHVTSHPEPTTLHGGDAEHGVVAQQVSILLLTLHLLQLLTLGRGGALFTGPRRG